ncbi:MAG: aspartate aminotransferase family protein, partial [Pikeienuella sp.]
QICGDETLFDIYFTEKPCRDYRSAQHDNPAQNAAYNTALRKRGIFKSPGKLYPSLAVSADDLQKTREAVSAAVREVFPS